MHMNYAFSPSQSDVTHFQPAAYLHTNAVCWLQRNNIRKHCFKNIDVIFFPHPGLNVICVRSFAGCTRRDTATQFWIIDGGFNHSCDDRMFLLFILNLNGDRKKHQIKWCVQHDCRCFASCTFPLIWQHQTHWQFQQSSGVPGWQRDG